MKKNRILLILIILVSNLGIAISYENKIFSSKDEYIYNCGYKSLNWCDILLSKSGKYEIQSGNKYADMVGSTLISDGTYKIENNYLILHDKYNGFFLKFYYKNNAILSKTFLKFGLRMKFYSTNFSDFDNSLYVRELIKVTTLEKVRFDFERNNKKINPLAYGLYGSCVYNILIKKNNYCYIKYLGRTYTEGYFKRKGNELIIYDPYLKHKFYILICKKNKLVNTFFPYWLDTLEKYKGKRYS